MWKEVAKGVFIGGLGVLLIYEIVRIYIGWRLIVFDSKIKNLNRERNER